MKYLTLVTIDSPIELNPESIGRSLLREANAIAPNSMVAYGAEAIARALEPELARRPARAQQNMLMAQHRSAAAAFPPAPSPNEQVLPVVISQVRELLGSQVGGDSQPADFDEQVAAYARLVAFIATGYLDPNADVLTLTRAALTAGLTN